MLSITLSDLQQLLKLTFPGEQRPLVIQYGANDGVTEYAKADGRDFLYEFLLAHPAWRALLVEPIPSVFDRLRQNYAGAENELYFFCGGVDVELGYRFLNIFGRDGKSSSLVYDARYLSEVRKRDLDKLEQMRVASGVTESGAITTVCLTHQDFLRIHNFPRVDVVKLDIEGHDLAIVADILAAPAAQHPEVIMWEMHERENNALDHTIASAGFEQFRTGMNRDGTFADRVIISKKLLARLNSAGLHPEQYFSR